MECKQAHHSNRIEWRKAGWVRIILKKQTAILKLRFITFTWELMQKACELQLSLKCSMKMLSHLSLEKWGPLELLLQWSKYQLVISSQLQYFVFYPVFILRGRWRKRKHLSKIYVIAKQIWDNLLCNFRYCHRFIVSSFLLAIWLLLKWFLFCLS